MKHMAEELEKLPFVCQKNGGQRMRVQGLKRRCQELEDKLEVFLNSGSFICWMEKGENGRLALCAVPMELEQILFRDIWSGSIPAEAFIFRKGDRNSNRRMHQINSGQNKYWS